MSVVPAWRRAGRLPLRWSWRGRGKPRRRGSVLDDLDAHAPGGPLDLLHRGVDVVRVEVGHLRLRDLADLVAGDASRRLALREAGALLDTGGLAKEVRGRRRLEDERERAILEDRDLGRDDLAGLVGGLLVVRLRELDDVDAVRAERRTDRRRGRRLAGGQLQGQNDPDLLRHGGGGSFLSRVGLELLDLEEVELDRRLAAEDADEDLDLVALGIDLVDRANELGERAIGHANALALREGDPELRGLDAHVPED